MRRGMIIPAVLAAAVLLAVLSVYGSNTGGGPDDGTRTLPDLSASSESAEESVDLSDSGGPGSADAVDSVETAGSGETVEDGETAESGELPSSETGATSEIPSSETEDGGSSASVAEQGGAAVPEKPASEKPSTEKLSTEKPSSEKPSTAKPSTEERSTEKPSAEKPSAAKPASGTDKAEAPKPESPRPDKTETAEPAPSASKPDRAEAAERGESAPSASGTEGGPEVPTDEKSGETEPPASGTDGDDMDIGPLEITMERPPFDGHYLCPALAGTAETAVPVVLVLRSEAYHNGETARQWMEGHWEEWMADTRFAAEQDPALRVLSDLDERYAYYADDESFRGQGVSIYDNAKQELVLLVDLFSYLFPDNAAAAVSDGTNAQSLRWARLLRGRLYFSNASSLSAEKMGGHNAYLTAIDPWKGLLLWRTDPLVCGTNNFAVPGPADGGVLLCGCGSADGEGGFLYQVGMKTGEILDRTPLDSVPEWIVCANGAAYVHCTDRDYVFDVSYG